MLIRIENFYYDSLNGVINKDNKDHALTGLQKKLLDYFLQHPNKMLSKDELMQEVWGRIVTDNTISKFISVLRNIIEEDASNPEIIKTHFGQGFSFTGSTKRIPEKKYNNIARKRIWLVFLIIVIAIVIITVFYTGLNKTEQPANSSELVFDDSKIVIMPADFSQSGIDELQRQGYYQIIQSSFNNKDDEGDVIIENESNLSNKVALEKFWQIDKELVILQSNVVKNGEIYEAVMQLSRGAEILDTTEISANNLNELILEQMEFIGRIQDKKSENFVIKSDNPGTNDTEFIKALGYYRLGDFDKSRQMLSELLEHNENHFSARLQLARIYMHKSEYNQALSELNTLKSSPAYSSMSAEIELALAKVLYNTHQYEELIEALVQYQSTHLAIGEIKQSRMQIQIAEAYRALGDMQNAMKFYKQALIDHNDKLDADLFAQSIYGQAMILLNDSNDKTVLERFEHSLEYARQSNNLKLQIMILDEMAKMLWVGNQPEEGIELKAQAIKLMEIINDKSEVAKGLGTLAGFLIQTGRFIEAKKVNDRLGVVAKDLENDSLYMNYLHYDAVILMNLSRFEAAENQINTQLKLAIKSNNLAMQLDNAFIEFEFRLATGKTDNFIEDWQQRVELIKQLGFERYLVYMDYYLARYYKLVSETEKSERLFNNISEQAKSNNDIKILVDAQNELADMYINIDAEKSLQILNAIETYKPNVNPYLEIKARAMNKLGRKMEALSLLNQAKLVFNEGWKVENEILLEEIKKELANE